MSKTSKCFPSFSVIGSKITHRALTNQNNQKTFNQSKTNPKSLVTWLKRVFPRLALVANYYQALIGSFGVLFGVCSDRPDELRWNLVQQQ